MKKQLHSGVRWLFRLRGFLSGFILLAVLFGFSVSAISDGGSINLSLILILAVSYVILFLIIAEIYARMTYNRWFYDFTGEQLRLERGIIWKKYSNIPYERVQNVDITRGIIARLCGFSTVNIQTAGFSYSPNRVGQSEGYIPGVSVKEAEDIREFLMKKISKKSRSGL
jgi:putative membrane protein